MTWITALLKAMASDKTAQGFVQLDLENFQGGVLCNCFVQTAPFSDCPHGEKAFP